MKIRDIIRFSDGENGMSAVDNINGYCCNTSSYPIQIQVIVSEIDGTTTIYAIVEKE